MTLHSPEIINVRSSYFAKLPPLPSPTPSELASSTGSIPTPFRNPSHVDAVTPTSDKGNPRPSQDVLSGIKANPHNIPRFPPGQFNKRLFPFDNPPNRRRIPKNSGPILFDGRVNKDKSYMRRMFPIHGDEDDPLNTMANIHKMDNEHSGRLMIHRGCQIMNNNLQKERQKLRIARMHQHAERARALRVEENSAQES